MVIAAGIVIIGLIVLDEPHPPCYYAAIDYLTKVYITSVLY